MSQIPIFYGRVEECRPILFDMERYRGWLKRLDGKEIELVIRKKRSQRSLDQNAYYWACVVGDESSGIAGATGYEREEVHEILRQMFLLVEKNGFTYARSSASLDTTEMTDYIERCRRWAAMELHINIPDPGQVAT